MQNRFVADLTEQLNQLNASTSTAPDIIRRRRETQLQLDNEKLNLTRVTLEANARAKGTKLRPTR